MGVDYTAHYGFGVMVIDVPREDNQEIIEVLDDLLEDSPYTYFEVGSMYGDWDVDIYIINDNVIDNIDKDNGYCFIQSIADEMKLFLDSKGIEYEGVPNIVGGLQIW